jgi:hypothetical protein
MFRSRLALAALLALLGVSCEVHSQCTDGACAPVSWNTRSVQYVSFPPPAVGELIERAPVVTRAPAGASWAWQSVGSADQRAKQIQLTKNGAQVGTYWYETGLFYPMDRATQTWAKAAAPLPAGAPLPPGVNLLTGAKQPCPCGPGCPDCSGDCATCKCLAGTIGVPTAGGLVYNGGLASQAIDRQQAVKPTVYRLNDQEITKEKAIERVQRGIPDDRGKLRVTAIGKPEARQKVADDLARSPELAAVRDLFLFQAYNPDDQLVRDYGFKTDGQPTIYVATPNGEVLHRQDDYAGGAPALATAIRKANDQYQAAKDSDLRKANWLDLSLLKRLLRPSLMPDLDIEPMLEYAAVVIACVVAWVAVKPLPAPEV